MKTFYYIFKQVYSDENSPGYVSEIQRNMKVVKNSSLTNLGLNCEQRLTVSIMHKVDYNTDHALKEYLQVALTFKNRIFAAISPYNILHLRRF